jgi:hypothetical protein
VAGREDAGCRLDWLVASVCVVAISSANINDEPETGDFGTRKPRKNLILHSADFLLFSSIFCHGERAANNHF